MEYTIYPFRYILPSEGWAAFLNIAFNIVKNMERPNENKKKNKFIFIWPIQEKCYIKIN